jgi:hypothetical protein
MAAALDQQRFRSDHAGLRGHTHPVEDNCTVTLARFRSHNLEEQTQVNLADRTDSKYLLPIRALTRFLEALGDEHTVLESSDQRIFTYENTYFDTPGWDLYLNHHNGRLSRHKWRFRRYRETDIAYLEYKLKTNKLRTVKSRVSTRDTESLASLQKQIPEHPSLYVNYRRMTFWNRASDERLTIDFDLHFQRPEQQAFAQLPNVFIAELKREGKPYGSTFVRRAKDFGFTPLSFSKYCVGVCMTDSGVLKQNRFKPLLNKLSKLHHSGGLQG